MDFLRNEYSKFPALQLPDFKTNGSRIKNNTNKWWEEIKNCAEEIRYSFAFMNAYNQLSKKYHENLESSNFERGYEILLFEQPFWIRNLLDRLYSFREKIAHLIFYLFDKRLTIKKKKNNSKYERRDISFHNIQESVSVVKSGMEWLNSNDINKVKQILSVLKSEQIENLLRIRHAFVHRSKPAINSTSSGIIIESGEWIDDNKFLLNIEEESDIKYNHIKDEILKIWTIMKKEVNEISKLDFFQ